MSGLAMVPGGLAKHPNALERSIGALATYPIVFVRCMDDQEEYRMYWRSIGMSIRCIMMAWRCTQMPWKDVGMLWRGV